MGPYQVLPLQDSVLQSYSYEGINIPHMSLTVASQSDVD